MYVTYNVTIVLSPSQPVTACHSPPNESNNEWNTPPFCTGPRAPAEMKRYFVMLALADHDCTEPAAPSRTTQFLCPVVLNDLDIQMH
jgi:hypothetical protein